MMIICWTPKSMRSCTMRETNHWLLSERYCRTKQCQCMVTVLFMNIVHSTNNLQHVKWKLLQEVKVIVKTCSYSPSRWYTLFQHIQSTITYTCRDAATFKCSLPNDIELIASSEFQNYMTWGAPTSNFDGLSPPWLPWLLRFQSNILDWGTQHKPITTWWVCSIHPKIINTLALETLYPDE